MRNRVMTQWLSETRGGHFLKGFDISSKKIRYIFTQPLHTNDQACGEVMLSHSMILGS